MKGTGITLLWDQALPMAAPDIVILIGSVVGGTKYVPDRQRSCPLAPVTADYMTPAGASTRARASARRCATSSQLTR